MGKQLFKTLIKADHKLGDNEYVRGRLSGIALAMCDAKQVYAHEGYDKGYVYKFRCTKRRYNKFAKFVEKRYPGLCEFNIL